MLLDVKVGDYITGRGMYHLICQVVEVKRYGTAPDAISIGARVVEYRPHPNGYQYGNTPGAYVVGEIRWFSPVGAAAMPNYGYLAEAREWLAAAKNCKGKLRVMCLNYATDARLKLSRAIGGAYRIA